ncbi:unnamed protein product [Aspergillus oryzae RIB40]|uniref:DNA, SC102 n=1 Tax=Aspergillus oryzae (strain ATCC 42149 / RIB 40) TaxID=510516 RepID=Q2UAC2_ASPOR|nr:unnamed protein product [Aspergillus oryzae RIB40]BAE61493.1 unnamed protein product [Aspergillus oryzae RIB40]
MLLDKKANVNRVYRLPEFEDLWVRHETILWKRFEAYITGVGKDRAEVDWRRCVALQTMQLSTRIMAPTMQRWDRRHQQDVVEVLLRSDTLDVDSKETDTLRIPQATDNGEPDLIVTLAESKLMTAGPPVLCCREGVQGGGGNTTKLKQGRCQLKGRTRVDTTNVC